MTSIYTSISLFPCRPIIGVAFPSSPPRVCPYGDLLVQPNFLPAVGVVLRSS